MSRPAEIATAPACGPAWRAAVLNFLAKSWPHRWHTVCSIACVGATCESGRPGAWRHTDRETLRFRRFPMSGIGGLGGSGFSPAAIKQFAQNLFSQIDLSGDG